VRHIRPEDNVATGREAANFDQFVAVWSLEEDKLRAAWRLVALHLFKPEYVLIKGDGFHEIVHAIAGVEKFFDHGV
jgi:hypothetical protein